MRLKGGDPFVFGRGGEEAEALAAAGIPFEVVPGITAGVAAPAYAGIPVTHRDDASAVAFVTGHEDPAKPESALDWDALAAFPGTLVFYMGVRNLERIAGRSIEAGRPEDEPVAVIERGTSEPPADGHRARSATSRRASPRPASSRPRSPWSGAVVDLREDLAWFERSRPLHGEDRRRHARARAGERAGGAARRRARRRGGRGAGDHDRAVAAARRSTPRCGRSATTRSSASRARTAIRPFFDALDRQGLDARALAGVRFAVIGETTAAQLAARGVRAGRRA